MTIHSHRPKPLVTVGLVGYNHERYVRDAIAGVLGQTYEPLDIILSDDCSSDRTFEIMQEMATSYRGPHQIRLNRNNLNIGIASHFTKLMDMARGEIFVGSASDDISDPSRIEKTLEVFLKNSRAQCVWSNAQIIDAEGRNVGLFAPEDFAGMGAYGPGPLCTVVREPWVLGATAAYRMTAWEAFGPLRQEIAQEDSAMAWRCRLLGDICYIPEQLVKYRQHGQNLFNYRTRSVATALGVAKAKSGCQALRLQAFADLKIARKSGLLGWGAFIYYALANHQRYLSDDMTRWAANQDLVGWRADLLRWAVEQPKRVMRAVDSRITQKILLPKS